MKSQKRYYISIIIGTIIAFSRSWFSAKYSQILLLLGIISILWGIYHISKKLPPKRTEDFQPPLVIHKKTKEKKEHNV